MGHPGITGVETFLWSGLNCVELYSLMNMIERVSLGSVMVRALALG